MKKKILVPIDFSGCSINALEIAIHLARKINASLIIMNACPRPVDYASPNVINHSADFMREAEDSSKEAFESIEKAIPALQEVSYKFQVKHAPVQDAIISMTMMAEVDLIVMGTTGASGLKEILMGSNAYAVTQSVTCPVLAIPEASKSGKAFHNIVLAGDYQDTASKETFEILTDIAKTSNAEIHVLHVSHEPVIKPNESEEAQKLDRYFKNLNHSFHFKVDTHFDEGINDYIDENGIDLLTLVSKKHNLLDRIFKSSMTRKMAYHSQTPLLILHAN